MMKTLFRWVFIFIGVLVLLVGIASAIAWHYKPELTAAIHEKIRENINGEFNIDDISVSVVKDFPQVSVTLEGIYLRGLKYETYKKDFLRAGKVVVNVNLFKLLSKEVDVTSIRISEAEVFIFTTKSGYSNLDIFKVKQNIKKDTLAGQNPDILNIHKIYLDNVGIAIQDSSKGKEFGFHFRKGENEVIRTDSSRQFHYAGEIDFDKLQFNASKGGYLSNQHVEAHLNGEFVAAHHTLKIEPSSLKFPSSSLQLSGGFHFVPAGSFTLNILSENLNYTEGRSLLPKSLGDKVSNYDIGSPFELRTTIIGSLAPGSDPSIDLHFATTDAHVKVGKEEATHVSMKGSFTNHVDSTSAFSDKNSRIQISSFDGKIYGLPVKLKASFINLLDPSVDLNVIVECDAKSLQHEIDSTILKVSDGSLTSTFSIKGKLKAILEPARYGNAAVVTGRTEIKKMKIVWVARTLTLDNLNGILSLKQNQISIDQFSFLLNRSKMFVRGSIVRYTPWLSTPAQKGFVRLEVTSPDLNLTGLLPDSRKDTSVQTKQQQMKSISRVIDNVYKRLEFDVAINIAKFQQRNFKASQITGSIALKNNELIANTIRLSLAGGDADVTFGLSQLNKPVNPLWVQANVHQADIRKFFYGFGNFNQHTIDSQNLSGTINANIGFNGFLDDDFNLMMPTLIGNVDLTVKDGKLSHFPPLEKMSNFLFKDRDFSDVDFAEIKSTFALKGTELSISRMEVESSVLSLFIEGRYSLADSTDLTIQLPLSNLKRHHKDYKPRNVGTDTKVGPSVYLRARSDGKGSVAIAYDPFHKFRKK